MLSVLFWNLNRQRRESLVANLARLHHVDVLVLAECPNPTAVLRALNQSPVGRMFFWHQPTHSCRLAVFSRFPPHEFTELESSQRYSVHSLSTATAQEFLLASVHASSGLVVSEVEQDEELRAMAKRVAEIENFRGHTRTLLNADPFDRRVHAATGLHAEKTRRIAGTQSRKVQRVVYRFFYNPMWRFMGQQPPDPEGTYFRRKAEHSTRFWHVFDQVLLRPDLLPYFAEQDVHILRDDGTTSF